MQCNRDELLQFVRAELQTQETERVVEHLETCGDCSSFLDTMVRLRANRQQISEALEPAQAGQRSGDEGRVLAWPKREESTRRGFLARSTQAIAAVLMLAVGVALLYQLLRRPQPDMAMLVTHERYPYQPMILRGEPSTPDELFSLGIRHYERNELSQAQPLLERYIEQNPSDADAYFYLGVIYYLTGNLPQARQVLESGLKVRTIQPEEKFHWYLAQVYLRLRYKELARLELEKVLIFRGEFSNAARAILSQLP